MAEQNILAGDVNVLDQMINDLNVHKETIERQGRLAESIGDIAKNTKEAQQAVQDEIDSRVKYSSDAVCAGFDKAIAGDREKLKEVQNKRDKAKLAGVKERIAAETAHIHKENEALKNQVKDAFAQENIPMFCNSRIYIALYRTKRMTDVLIYLLCIALVYAAVPFLLSVIPQFPLWGMILYYVVVILIQSFTNKMIVEKTLVRHAETIDMAKKLKEQIRSNHKKMKKIAKNIKTDSNEEMYGLHEFDDKMNEIREDMKRIEQEKEKALEDFEMTVKPDIIAEIEGRENERINAMKAELDKKSAENLKLENLIKEQRIYISSNYEAYLGKEYVTVEKLTELKQVMISGGAATVAQALAVYREKHL